MSKNIIIKELPDKSILYTTELEVVYSNIHKIELGKEKVDIIYSQKNDNYLRIQGYTPQSLKYISKKYNIDTAFVRIICNYHTLSKKIIYFQKTLVIFYLKVTDLGIQHLKEVKN